MHKKGPNTKATKNITIYDIPYYTILLFLRQFKIDVALSFIVGRLETGLEL